VLTAQKNIDFDLAEAFKGTDSEFCKRFNIDVKTL
jgi:hypothetical protein